MTNKRKKTKRQKRRQGYRTIHILNKIENIQYTKSWHQCRLSQNVSRKQSISNSICGGKLWGWLSFGGELVGESFSFGGQFIGFSSPYEEVDEYCKFESFFFVEIFHETVLIE